MNPAMLLLLLAACVRHTGKNSDSHNYCNLSLSIPGNYPFDGFLWTLLDLIYLCWYLENILVQDLIFTEKKLIFSIKFVRVRQKSSIFCNKAGGSKMTVSSAHIENFVKIISWTKKCHNYHQIWDPASSMKTALAWFPWSEIYTACFSTEIWRQPNTWLILSQNWTIYDTDICKPFGL